jgi:hypothetical protein
VDQGAADTDAGRAPATPGTPARPASELGSQRAASKRTKRRLALDLSLLGLVGVLLVGAVAAAVITVSREFYSPTAFVERYLSLLADGHAAEALTVPGVAVESADLEAAGLPASSSQALLRRDALATLSDVRVVSEETEGDITHVTVEYRAGDYPGTTTFDIERDGSVGLVPTWRFATSPLAVMELAVGGSMTFDVNGFSLDKRQVSAEGVDADPTAPVALLVFSPGIYSVSVDNPIAATPGVAVLSDSPFRGIPVEVQAQPTPQFLAVVQERVEEFLTACATQEVLLPTACPFGYRVEDRVASPPQWSIVKQPAVTVEPDGAAWEIPPAEAVARIEVDVRSLFDGSIYHVSEDVPFLVTGAITVMPDGRATITVGGPDTN